jgi:hypothetical protein
MTKLGEGLRAGAKRDHTDGGRELRCDRGWCHARSQPWRTWTRRLSRGERLRRNPQHARSTAE